MTRMHPPAAREVRTAVIDTVVLGAACLAAVDMIFSWRRAFRQVPANT
jgi:hypothetical protein